MEIEVEIQKCCFKTPKFPKLCGKDSLQLFLRTLDIFYYIFDSVLSCGKQRIESQDMRILPAILA